MKLASALRRPRARLHTRLPHPPAQVLGQGAATLQFIAGPCNPPGFPPAPSLRRFPCSAVPTPAVPQRQLVLTSLPRLPPCADQAPGKVAPENGTPGRYEVQHWLNYISSEVHGSIGPLFNPANKGAIADWNRANLERKLTYLNDKVMVGGKKYLVGDKFSVADSYLYIVLTWFPYLGLDVAAYPNLKVRAAFAR